MKNFLIVLCLSLTIFSKPSNAQSNFVGSGVALHFNGNHGNYVNLGDVYNNLAFPFTVEAWIRIEAYPEINGCIISSDNDLIRYEGFWFSYSHTAQLFIEFGNSEGAGFQYRRGVTTVEALPLQKWIHVAAVCNSITDIQLYVNGTLKTSVPTDGGSTSTSMVHNSSVGNIGRWVNPFNEQNVTAQVDEIRLWNVARTSTNLRDFMCKKLIPNSTGLIGYWTSDESFTNSMVNDNTTPAENGSVVGTVKKIRSGAPIGDESEYLYTSNWSGAHVALTSLSGDELSVHNVTGSPQGVHVYLVNSLPYSPSGLNTVPPYYYGVYCTQGTTITGYKIDYQYSSSNGTINSENENQADLSCRPDGSIPMWSDLNGILDTASNEISKSNQKVHREYILNIDPSLKLAEEAQNSDELQDQITLYPNPAVNQIQIDLSKISSRILNIRVLDLTSKTLFENTTVGASPISIDLSGLKSGFYIVEAITETGNSFQKFEVQR